MWIRTQNKRRLIECNNIVVRKGVGLASGKYTIENNTPEIDAVLGIYSTEEVALKVLDNIQNYINRNLLNIYNPKLGIFEMPQEDEVE